MNKLVVQKNPYHEFAQNDSLLSVLSDDKVTYTQHTKTLHINTSRTVFFIYLALKFNICPTEIKEYCLNSTNDFKALRWVLLE